MVYGVSLLYTGYCHQQMNALKWLYGYDMNIHSIRKRAV